MLLWNSYAGIYDTNSEVLVNDLYSYVNTAYFGEFQSVRLQT